MVVVQRAADHQPGREAGRQPGHVDEREGDQQPRAFVQLAGVDHRAADDQPLVVVARHALGLRLGARGPADRQHVVRADAGASGAHAQCLGVGRGRGLEQRPQRCDPGRPVRRRRVAERRHRRCARLRGGELGPHAGLRETADRAGGDHPSRAGARQHVAELVGPVLHRHRRDHDAGDRAGEVDRVQRGGVGQLHHDHVVATQPQLLQHLGPAADLLAQPRPRPGARRLAVDRRAVRCVDHRGCVVQPLGGLEEQVGERALAPPALRDVVPDPLRRHEDHRRGVTASDRACAG